LKQETSKEKMNMDSVRLQNVVDVVAFCERKQNVACCLLKCKEDVV
jgi:hypothetical protein